MARGLTPQLVQLPFVAGLNQNSDARAKQPPFLDICKDLRLDKQGGLQQRYPFAGLGANILGGGVITNPRKLAANGDELLLFTDVALYSWSARDVAWVFRGEHLAVSVDEETQFAVAEDQVDCDRVELGNVVFYTWTGTNLATSLVYLAARDKTTGAMILAPTPIDPGVAGTRPRLLALNTRVLVTWSRSLIAGLVGIVIDPANIAASIVAPTNICAQGLVSPYDLVKVPGQDLALLATALSPTTSYLVASITSAMVVTTVTKVRTCDGPIAISVDPTSVFVQIVRANGANIQGDRLNLALADTGANGVAIGTAVGTVGHIAAAHRSVADGAFYRCYCFWSSGESAGAGVNWTSKSNWIDTNAAHGVEANFIRLLAPASRAFDYAGRVYVWFAFAGASSTAIPGFVEQLQNTYFLYRDDAAQVSKACDGNAGGLPATTMLPGVALVDGATSFAWCGTMRRIVPVGTNAASLGYAERAPRDVSFTFDSDVARRCVQLGQTLYVAGGQVLQYDGAQLAELGFDVYPWAIGANPNGAGSIPNGTYAYKATWKWPNAKGEVDRSTTATVVSAVVAAGPEGVDVVVNPLYTTRKLAQPPALEVWRTEINPEIDAPFYLVTSPDPQVLSGSNDYIANDPTVFPLPTLHDALTDGQTSIRQNNPENGAILENLAPTGATIIAADQNRLYLAGIPGSPNVVLYSKQRGADQVAAFNDQLTVLVPALGGPITALSFINETLVAFERTAIYLLPGDGIDNSGGGQNFGPARTISSDCGAISAESVAVTPMGIVFKSLKGWYLLDRSFGVSYIGDKVRDYDGETVYAAHVVPSCHELRIVTSGRVLVLYYRINQWAEWSIVDGLGACIWQDTYLYLSAAGAQIEQATLALANYGWDLELAWIKLNDLQGAGRVWWIMLLGEWLAAFALRVRIARDYQSDGAGGWAYFDDKYPAGVTSSPPVVGGPLQVRIGPSQQQVQAIKVRFTAVDVNNHAVSPIGEVAKLTGLALEVGIDQGLYKRLPAAQKA